MDKNKKNNKLIFIIIFSAVFGVLGGVAGEMLARAYLIDSAFNVPFFTEINFGERDGMGSNLVIRNPRKVVVEQNKKVKEMSDSVIDSIAGIYKKKEQLSEEKRDSDTINFNPENYYRLKNRIGEAFILTSDGWMISNFKPKSRALLSATSSIDLPKEIIEEYVVISRQKKVYEIDRIVVSDDMDYSFWKIDSSDLNVLEIVSAKNINNGQVVVGIDFNNKIEISTIKGFKDNNDDLVKSSDDYKRNLVLSDNTEKGFFYFNLEGGIVGFADDGGKLDLIDNYIYAIDSLLNGEKIVNIEYGINYIDLSEFVDVDKEREYRGAKIYKNKNNRGIVKDSLAERAGLLEGDIILSVNNIELNKENDLAGVLSYYGAGDDLDLKISRKGEEKRLKIRIPE